MRSKTCRKLQAPITRTLIATAVSACFVPLVFALPLGPGVVNGSASFVQNGNTLTVTNSNQAIINWQSFSIGNKEIARFVQPSANSSVLNRVLGNDPSQLLGALQSNGRVFLINPAGVLVGQGARVDVAGFAASTLNLSNSDFLANRLRFGETPGAGKVQNLGEITTPSGGSVYLVAPQIDNGGIISAPNGEVLLAAGQRVELIDTATPGVRVAVVGSAGNATNLGTITAEAGRIGIAGVLVKNSGTLNASSVISEGGRIFLKASGDTLLSGDSRISATGARGGNVEVLGQRVALTEHARIDASGRNGGGSVLVGGDYQGKNVAIQNAQVTYFGKDASIQADALENGDGGKVIVWADDTTRFSGSISARGGTEGGNGGNAEVSGKAYLDFKGTVDLSAKSGITGTLLLDPTNITIGANADLNGDTTLGDDVAADVLVGDNAAATSQITATQVGTLLNTTSLSLAASNNITVSSAINKTANTANITLALTAGNAIALNAPISAAAGGLSVELTAGAGGITQTAGIVTAEKLKITSSGNVNLTEGNLVGTLAASMSAGAGSLSFSNAQSLDIASIGGTNGIIFTGNSSPINISTSAGNLTLYQPILADGLGGGMITLTAANAIDLQAAITASNNSIPAGPVKLTAGAGGITGNPSGIITADGLAVVSLGNVELANASHIVSKVAANIGNASNQERYFRLKSTSDLMVDTVSGINGILIALGTGNYVSNTPGGVIALESTGGSLTQASGALLAGRAVVAESGNTSANSVTLTEANPTGIIAGKSGSGFSYTSSNPIFLTEINTGTPKKGISAALGSAGGDITLTTTNAGAGINADTNHVTASLITTGKAILTASTGVSLTNDNSVAKLKVTATGGDIRFRNTSDLEIADAVSTTSGYKVQIGLPVANTLSISGPDGLVTGPAGIDIFAGTVAFPAGSAAGISAPAGVVRIATNSFSLGSSGAITANGFRITPATARAIEVTSGACGAGTPLCLQSSDLVSAKISASEFGLGLDIDETDSLAINTIPAATSIVLNGPLTRSAGAVYLASSGNISQAATGLVTASTLGASSASGNVDLNVADNVLNSVFGHTTAGSFALRTAGNLSVASATPFGGPLETGIQTSVSTVLSSANGDISIDHPVSGGSTAKLKAYGNIQGSERISAISADLSSDFGGIGSSTTPLKTAVSSLSAKALNSIYVVNNSSANPGPLNIAAYTCNTGGDACASPVGGFFSTSGSIKLTNYGAFVTPDLPGSGFLPPSPSEAIQASGNIDLLANSPLTIGTSGIRSTGGGNITLTAANSGDLVLNGSIATTGSILLNAPNGVVTGAPTFAPTGVVTTAASIAAANAQAQAAAATAAAAEAEALAAAQAAAEAKALADAKAAAEAKALADAQAAAEAKALADAQAAAEAKALADAQAAAKALADAEALKAKEEAAILTRVTEETVVKVAVVEAVVGAQTRTAAAMTPSPVVLLRTETSGSSGTLFAGRTIGGSTGEFGAPSPDSQPVLTPFAGSATFSGQAAPAGGLEIEIQPSESRAATSAGGNAASKPASDKANQKSDKEATDDAKVAKKKPAQCT